MLPRYEAASDCSSLPAVEPCQQSLARLGDAQQRISSGTTGSARHGSGNGEQRERERKIERDGRRVDVLVAPGLLQPEVYLAQRGTAAVVSACPALLLCSVLRADLHQICTKI